MVSRLLSILPTCALLIALIAASPLMAQSTFGSIVGTVKDTSNALLPGAVVTLTNAGTSAARTTQTNSAGEYSFLNLNAGKYQITVIAQGFGEARIR